MSLQITRFSLILLCSLAIAGVLGCHQTNQATGTYSGSWHSSIENGEISLQIDSSGDVVGFCTSSVGKLGQVVGHLQNTRFTGTYQYDSQHRGTLGGTLLLSDGGGLTGTVLSRNGDASSKITYDLNRTDHLVALSAPAPPISTSASTTTAVSQVPTSVQLNVDSEKIWLVECTNGCGSKWTLPYKDGYGPGYTEVDVINACFADTTEDAGVFGKCSSNWTLDANGRPVEGSHRLTYRLIDADQAPNDATPMTLP